MSCFRERAQRLVNHVDEIVANFRITCFNPKTLQPAKEKLKRERVLLKFKIKRNQKKALNRMPKNKKTRKNKKKIKAKKEEISVLEKTAAGAERLWSQFFEVSLRTTS